MMESRDRVLRLNHLSFRLYSLAALGFSRSGFFYVRNRNSPTLQRYRNFHSYRLPSPNPYGPFEFWLSRSTLFSWLLIFYHRPDERTNVLSSLQKIFPIFSNFIDKRTCRDFRQVKTCPMLYSLKLFSFKNSFLIFYSENPNHYTKCSSWIKKIPVFYFNANYKANIIYPPATL